MVVLSVMYAGLLLMVLFIVVIIVNPFIYITFYTKDKRRFSWNKAPLSKAHQEKYQNIFEHPEMFFRVGNEIRAVKVETQDCPRSSKHR